tara:strand:+ start:1146 stop:1658 length:513 start_codon:yes stop_codon:yes gene_type:complete
MAGRLVQVNKTVSGGSDTTLKVTGIDSDDVYLLVLKLIQTQNNNEVINMRVTKSGTADSTSNYDRAYKHFSSTGSFSNGSYENGTGSRIMENVDDANGGGQGIFYLYNFNSSSTYSWWTNQNVTTVSNQSAGSAGGHIHTVASASDGIEVYGSSGGTFISGASAILYKVV